MKFHDINYKNCINFDNTDSSFFIIYCNVILKAIREGKFCNGKQVITQQKIRNVTTKLFPVFCRNDSVECIVILTFH